MQNLFFFVNFLKIDTKIKNNSAKVIVLVGFYKLGLTY